MSGLDALRVWLDAVRRHQPGDADEAAAGVASLSPDALNRLFPYLITLADLASRHQPSASPGGVASSPSRDAGRPAHAARQRLALDTRQTLSWSEVGRLEDLSKQDELAADPDRLLLLAATLHADAAMLFQDRLAAAGREVSPIARFRFLQGRYVLPLSDRDDSRRMAIDSLHWQIARWLLTFVSRQPATTESVRVWYDGTAAFLVGDLDFPELDPHLTDALVALPDDPRMLFVAGYLHETQASAMVQNEIQARLRDVSDRQRLATPGPRGPVLTCQMVSCDSRQRPFGIGLAAENLEQAEKLLTRALERTPDFGEARVRLGHVLAQRNRHAAAVEQLQRVLAGPLEPAIAYAAALFLGSSQEALGRLEAAAAAYERALALFPSAQSARLALSHLQYEEGRQSIAAATLRATPGNDVGAGASADDPWWTYHDWPAGRSGAVLDSLWARMKALAIR